MEEIIGLLVVLAVGIFKAVNKKFEDAGKQPQKPSQPFGPFGSLDPFEKDQEVLVPKAEPAAPRREPVAPRPVTPKPVEIRPAAATPQPMTFDFEDVQRQTKARKPMLIEEEETSPREKIDPKKLVLYSEIMNPKFNEQVTINQIIMALQYMTQEGLDKLKKELAEAIAQRPVISAAIAEARDKGDLSENAEYEAAREAQGLLELNIAKLQNLVANARVIDESQIGTDKVQMLNKVKVKNLNTNQIMNFTLVSEQEADFMAGKLAVKTPIGQALMGHGVGEVVEAKVPAGIIKFEILEITL